MSVPTRATYRTMAEGTAEDYILIERAEEANNAGLVPRVLGLVEALAEGAAGLSDQPARALVAVRDPGVRGRTTGRIRRRSAPARHR